MPDFRIVRIKRRRGEGRFGPRIRGIGVLALFDSLCYSEGMKLCELGLGRQFRVQGALPYTEEV
jgi:hypothetical protein